MGTLRTYITLIKIITITTKIITITITTVIIFIAFIKNSLVMSLACSEISL